jgi:LCP family protein required for cell wall assembly
LEQDISETGRARGARNAAATAVRHINPLLIAGIAIFAAISFYSAMVVASHIDNTLFFDDSLSVSADIPGVKVDEQPEEVTAEDRINILVMGLDLRRDEDPNIAARTDTVFVFTIDPYSNTAGVLSIPRDTAVDIPVTLGGEDGYFSDRVNTAYVYGENQEKGDGPKYAKEAVERFLDADYTDDELDVPINYYAVLNFNNFISIVDELGGIDIDVPEYIYDTAYNDCNECGYYYVEFDEGPQHMDGETALTYARLRHSDNDFKRIERQQLVMRAIAKKAATLDLFDVGKATGLFNSYKDAIKTDIPDTRLGGFAKLGARVNIDNMAMESLADATYPCPSSQCNGAAILLPIPDKVEEIKNRVFGDGRLQQEAALIKVVNGTPTPKLGEQFASFLRSEGIASDRITVDEQAGGFLYENTFVIVHGEGEYPYTTERIAEWLGHDNTRVRRFVEMPIEMQAQLQDDLVGITVVLATDSVVPDAPRTVSDYVPDESSYDPDYYEPEVIDEYVPEDTPEPIIEPEITPEPPPEPTPPPPPEPTPEPPPIETPPPEGGGEAQGISQPPPG